MQTMMTLLAGLASATVNTPASEELSVERAARQYRIHVYDTYRTDRDSYDRFRKSGDELLVSWRTSGQPGNHRDQVVGWYRDASANSLATSLPPLPDLPVRLPPEPEATVDADLFSSPETERPSVFQTLTPLPMESDDELLESAEEAGDPSDSLPISTSAAPAEEDTRTVAEKWSDAPKSIMTIGQFMFGLGGS